MEIWQTVEIKANAPTVVLQHLEDKSKKVYAIYLLLLWYKVFKFRTIFTRQY